MTFVIEHIGGILSEITEQGRDIINAKTHLGKLMAWHEWLENHVPNLPVKTAAKYERITTEGITDPRQAVFAFLPEPDRRPLPRRRPPDPWEVAWHHLHKFFATLRDAPLEKWHPDRLENLRAELYDACAFLWPDKFAGPVGTDAGHR